MQHGALPACPGHRDSSHCDRGDAQDLIASVQLKVPCSETASKIKKGAQQLIGLIGRGWVAVDA